MALILMNAGTQAEFVRRVEKIAVDTPRLWGSMQPIDAIAHMRRAFDISLAEVEVKDESNFFLRNVLGPIAFSGWLPWPKGKLKAMPVFMAAAEGDIESEKKKMIAAMERFIKAADKEPGKKALSPNFGWLPLSFWRQIHGIHTDHHLRQYGV